MHLPIRRLVTNSKQMEELFEAASWAASAFNEQPWRYVYAHQGTGGFKDLFAALSPGNQSWAEPAKTDLQPKWKSQSLGDAGYRYGQRTSTTAWPHWVISAHQKSYRVPCKRALDPRSRRPVADFVQKM